MGWVWEPEGVEGTLPPPPLSPLAMGQPLDPALDSMTTTPKFPGQGRKLLSCSQSQEMSQCSNLAPDWLIKSEQPIRSRLCLLTQLLTMTTAQKFPSLVGVVAERAVKRPLEVALGAAQLVLQHVLHRVHDDRVQVGHLENEEIKK